MNDFIIDQRDLNYYNGWIPFSKEIKKRGKMLFWDRVKDDWFEGVLIDDPEYGLRVSTFEEYRAVDNISFFKIINGPI